MTSEKIVPPFKADGDIHDSVGHLVVVSPDIDELYDFTRELCRIMNKNANALCHAANGEGYCPPMDDLILHVGANGVPFSMEIKNHYENTKEEK